MVLVGRYHASACALGCRAVLRDILQTIGDCNDIWISQVQHLETLVCELHRILKFVPKRGEDGNIIWGADWVLIEHSKEDDDD